MSLETVREAEAIWQPFLLNAIEEARQHGATVFDLPEHKHWDWLRKARYAIVRRNYRLLGMVCDGEMQGMMILRLDLSSRREESLGEPLVYVDYLAAALRSLTNLPRFAGVGRGLLGAAVQTSDAMGWSGRVGLHALPQAERFYEQVCGMVDLGLDPDYDKLRYFEMGVAEAHRFLRGGSG